MIEQDSSQGEQSAPKLGPGDRLQAARISKGMTVEEVASKMHLSVGILSSLEENHFEDITAPIFVKGYLRAYSRLVSLDEDEIIQQYLTFYMNGDPPISSTSNTSPEINSDDSKVKWITYIVIIGLIALLATWWWNRYQQTPETLSLEGRDNLQTEIMAADDTVETAPQISTTEEEQNSLQLEIKSVVDSMGMQQEPADNQQMASEDPEPVDNIESVSEQNMEVDESVSMEPVDDQPQAEMVIEPPLSNNNDLVITVNADTWASIKDATGKKLVYDLLRSGEKITVTGQAPISAFLGNGYGVTMTYKGEDVDLNSVIRSDNTARLKIGQ